jgi:hypothetical protein
MLDCLIVPEAIPRRCNLAVERSTQTTRDGWAARYREMKTRDKPKKT